MRGLGVFDQTWQKTVLNQQLSGGEAKQLRHCLPPALGDLWYRAEVSD